MKCEVQLVLRSVILTHMPQSILMEWLKENEKVNVIKDKREALVASSLGLALT